MYKDNSGKVYKYSVYVDVIFLVFYYVYNKMF